MNRLADIFRDYNLEIKRDYISKNDVVEEMKKYKIYFKYRTIDYYASLGIIKKASRKISDKRVFWEKDYIINELLAIAILTSVLNKTLLEVQKIAKETNYNLESVAINSLKEDLYEKKNKRN